MKQSKLWEFARKTAALPVGGEKRPTETEARDRLICGGGEPTTYPRRAPVTGLGRLVLRHPCTYLRTHHLRTRVKLMQQIFKEETTAPPTNCCGGDVCSWDYSSAFIFQLKYTFEKERRAKKKKLKQTRQWSNIGRGIPLPDRANIFQYS